MALDAHEVNVITKNVVGKLAPRLARMERRIAIARHGTRDLEERFAREVAATNRKFYTVFTDVTIMRDEIAALHPDGRDTSIGDRYE